MKKINKNFYWWLFFSGLILYLPSLFFNFTYFDDNVLVLEHLGFLKNPLNIGQAFRQDVFHINNFSAFYYRPLLTISFMIDAFFSGSKPFGYHLTNVLIHLLTTMLVFKFLTKINIEKKPAFFLSLFFLVHPLMVQAVSWIPGRNDSLLTLFFLLAFIFFLKFLEKQQVVYLFFHNVFLMLAILTKETAIIAPLIFLVYIWFFIEKIKIYNMIQIFINWFFLFLIWFFLRLLAINNILYLNQNDIFLSLIKNSPAIFLYLQKIIFPIKLSVLPLLNKKDIWLGVVVFILLTGTLFLKKEKNTKKIIFGILWFFSFLIPSFIRPNTAMPADFLEHRIYLSLVGFLIIFSETSFFQKIFEKKIYLTYFFIFLSFLSFKTFFHQFNFQNRDVFWQRAVKNSPLSPLAHRNHGVMLYFQNKTTLALKEYQKALELNPEEPMAHNNIGVIYLNQGKLQQAQIEFEKELKINPNYDLALTNLGIVFYRQNKLDQAAFYYQKAIMINPSSQNYLALVEIYQKKNEPEKAAYFFKLSQLLKSE